MPVPNHKPGCVTKTFITQCPDCKRDVFFFSCNCGSLVYFDELGFPWTIHSCKQYAIRKAIELLKDVERLHDDEIRQKIEEYSKRHSQVIDEEIEDLIDNEIGRLRKPIRVKEIEVTDEIDCVGGIVMEINKSINFHKKFNIESKGEISVKLLGVLGKETYDEVILREGPDKNNVVREFRVLVDAKRNSIRKSQNLIANLKIVKSAFADVWVITDFKTF